MHSYWQDLVLDCNTSLFAHLYQSYCPWYTLEFRFSSIYWELIDRISPNLYAFILTRSSFGLLHIIFCAFVSEVWPLIYARISFPLNIFRTTGQNSQNFIYALTLTRSRLELGIIHINLRTFVAELWPSIYARISFRSISWKQIDRISPNFINALLLTKSRLELELLHIIFRTFVAELWPLLNARISFPLNILRKNWKNFTRFYILKRKSFAALTKMLFPSFWAKYFSPWYYD